ncbi:MAG: tRNA pseudouridine(55) synthase TruB [Lachnospiraceae bacterium]|nr:tRNA pseudouridine(55) synthase TruB [Lachnospiraceae bacterium]
MDGIINIYKEKGYTSHDVVAKLRGILKTKKIGHTGTLDPDAEGVLPVCVGRATKVCDMLTEKNKMYRTVLLLGKSTDTQDISGKILEENELPENLDEETVRNVIMEFAGEYMQIPPMYSALKVNGKKLYELARQGVEVERKARPVTILDINIEKIELPRITMTVTCSKGTYIRTLCHDIGQKLGTGGCMENLLRLESGIFNVQDSVKLSDVQKYMDENTIDNILIPIDKLFMNYASCKVKKKYNILIYNGNKFAEDNILNKVSPKDGEHFRIYDEDGNFIGIYKYDMSETMFIPVKMFLAGGCYGGNKRN